MKRSCFPFLGIFLQKNETNYSNNDLIFYSFLFQNIPHPSPTSRLAKCRKRTCNCWKKFLGTIDKKYFSQPPCCWHVLLCRGFPGRSVVNNLPAMQRTWVQSVGWKDSLEREMATHSTMPAWEIPWTDEPGGLWSMGSLKSWIQLRD